MVELDVPAMIHVNAACNPTFYVVATTGKNGRARLQRGCPRVITTVKDWM